MTHAMPTVTRTTTTPTPRAKTPAAAAKAWAEGFNFNSAAAVKKLQVARTKAPATGPTEVRRAFAFYRSWEANDLGNARLLKTSIDGKPGFALHTTTDGDLGFLELYSDKGTLLASGTTRFDAQGRPTIKWDTKPGAVRENVAPKKMSAAITAYNQAMTKAAKSGSPSGATVSVSELEAAAQNLVGNDLSRRSVDGREQSTLLRSLVEAKLSPAARAYAEQLAALYTPAANTTLTGYNAGPLGTASPFLQNARIAVARTNAAGSPPKLNTIAALAQRAFSQVPTQLQPVTRTEATALLRATGASAADAKAALEQVVDAKGQLYAGRFFDPGANGVVPEVQGLALIGLLASGRELRAIDVATRPTAPAAPDARAVINRLLGVDRPVEVAATRRTAAGAQLDLVWRPPTGGTLTARLDVPDDGSEPALSNVELPSVIGPTETGLGERISQRTGVAVQALSYAQAGPGWLVAHRPPAGGPISLSTVRVAVDGTTAAVTPANIGTGTAQLDVARMLSLGLARVRAEAMVADAQMPPAAKLEVALRTRWAQFADLQSVDPADSAVGFDPATERAQFMLPRVWGDNAVFVTFPNAGAVRVEDFN